MSRAELRRLAGRVSIHTGKRGRVLLAAASQGFDADMAPASFEATGLASMASYRFLAAGLPEVTWALVHHRRLRQMRKAYRRLRR